jgi:glycosyltransferase involved in cell wall biosynthesis
MKIAYVFDLIYPYEVGGAQKRIWELARRLAAKGHEITVFGMKYWNGDDQIYREGVRLWGVCPSIDIWEGNRRSVKEAVYFGWSILFPLLKEKYDVIDCQNFPYFSCFSSKIASMIKKSPFTITWLEAWGTYWLEYLGGKGIIGKYVEKLTTYLAKTVIALSPMTKSQLLELGMKNTIEVIPCGIPIKEIDAVLPGIVQSDVIFAGRLIKEKNIDVLIKAVAHIKQEIPSIKCIIVGDGPERNNLESLVSDLGLIENVFFVGFLQNYDDVIGYMKNSKVFVLPSTREGFGIVVLEANACGLPVVTIEHIRNAASGLIEEGKNGFNCKLFADDMAEKITKLLDNKIIGQKCVEYSKQFDWENIVNKVEAFYKEAVMRR